MATEFGGKRILVTGGANGLGKAIIKRFYESGSGAILFALDCDESALKNLKLEFPLVNTIHVDLLDWNASKKAVQAILPLNHLVNNAGIYKFGTLLEVEEENIDKSFGVNFKAAFNLTQVFAKGIIEHSLEGGTIVNISSVGDTTCGEGSTTYCCTKAAITMLTRCSATELGKHNIRVNSIRPTIMKTKLFADLLLNPQSEKGTSNYNSRAALKRDLETSDVANLVYFLSSSQSAMITGEDVAIDAGSGVA